MTGSTTAGAPPEKRRIVDFGRRSIRISRGPFALRLDVRPLAVCGILAAVAVLVSLAALGSGSYPLSITQIVAAFSGGESGLVRDIVLEWRLPRVLAALVFGAALGVSGGVFQALTRNPLASPDVVGFTTGSYTGALVVILITGGGFVALSFGALAGGLVTVLIVYSLSFRRGLQGFRLIIVGIGVSAMLGSLNTFLILRADLDLAITAAVWRAGSLNATSWEQVVIGAAAVLAILVGLGFVSRPLKETEFGDDIARSHGVRVEPSKLALVVLGVGLTAIVTAAAGPIAFVALAAPQIARRLTRAPGIALIPAAFTGAVLLAVADYLGQHALPVQLPVGLVTVVIGGTYLAWLLVAEVRKRV